ncbi:Hypothetical protein POVN_LOCUS318 [uncultured virus]|nr:Hypothetical protein POVN_LOCUS318 [uncultured virus]
MSTEAVLITVPVAADEKDKAAGSVGVHYWKIAKAGYFAGVNLVAFMIELTNAYLKACSEEEAKALAAKTHYLRAQTWYEGKESHVLIRTLSLKEQNDPKYATYLQHKIDAYVPFVMYLGKTWNHFGFLRQMLTARKVYPVLVPPHLEVDPVTGPHLVGGYVESGPFLFARESYPSESAASLAAAAADGVRIVSSVTTKEQSQDKLPLPEV